MLKRPTNKISLVVSSGLVLVALLGATWLTPRVLSWLGQQIGFSLSSEESPQQEQGDKQSAVLALASLSAEQREPQLKEIASSEKKSLDRSRARYLLASDLIKQYEGGPALRQLQGLEDDYPMLKPHILLKRGRAYELTNENTKAKETWQKLIESYPDSPVVAEALYMLGRSNPEYWEQAIAQFPHHPRTHQIVRERLKENPNQPQLLLLLAKYTPDERGMSKIRDRLVKEYASQLTPEDWEAIASGYWQQWEYGKAGKAYAKAPRTPRNAYRAARGVHIKGNKTEAKKAYKQLISEFPDAKETGLGLRRLASLSGRKEALGYLDIVISKFPDEAPEALLEKAKILDALNSRKLAAQARQALLTDYPNSETAAKYRWSVVQRLAAAGDLVKAWQWAQPITTNNPDSDLAPKAAFWIGKWAKQLGRQEDAKAAFEHVLASHPQSYYAWRSAVLLGWNVGDFPTVRQMSPQVLKPTARPLPPAGSDSFKELYLLRQDEDAWTLFQAEIGNREELTVAQQFTDGLLRLAKGKNLQGINRIWSLKQREDPQEQLQWQLLRQTPEYWYALFPFPFDQTILNWSGERQINPLLVTSLIRQESRFEPEIRSSAGATGLMQVMPGTGKWVAEKIDLEDYSLIDPDDNVNLGTWYLDYTHREYKNNSLLAVASYNAGPGNVAKWIRKYGLNDPDAFVEKIPFRETKGYVEAVFGNYWNYLRIYNPEVSRLLSGYTSAKILD
ncbi:MAG: transglycosylase SLT domain-containing protein [Xenococcaceae cyanobacterium]